MNRGNAQWGGTRTKRSLLAHRHPLAAGLPWGTGFGHRRAVPNERSDSSQLIGWAPARDGRGFIGNWAPGIGDASLGGWVTVMAYATAAILCWRTSLRVQQTRERTVWLVLCASLVALGLNKQLDLQTALTEAGRIVLRAVGGYEQRRVVQAVFVVVLAAASLGFTAWLARRAGAAPKATKIALGGFLLLVLFVGIRASSFHHVDRLIGLDFRGLRLNWLLELGGIGTLALGAIARGLTR